MFNLLRAVAVLAGLLTASAPAQAAQLKIGDVAPPLQAAQWLQGDPVQGFDSNHVYLVEFWATWCPDCRAVIPHLNELWQAYKDRNVIVIGQDCRERKEGDVPAFVKKMGGKMTYRVALDDQSQDQTGAMWVSWMQAAGQPGIPTAFIVNRQGRIAWIGDPTILQTNVLEAILADKFDVAAFAGKFEQQQVLDHKLRQSMKERNWEAADAALTGMEKSMPDSMDYQYSAMRLKILLGLKDYPRAYQLAESSSDAHPANADLQNGLAWSLATANGLDQPGLALAGKIAARAMTVSGGKDVAILDTLARVQFLNGKTNEAVVTEQQAMDAAADELKAALKESLTDYQTGKLPEVSE